MITYEVNKVTKQDVEQEVVDTLTYTPNLQEYDIEPNRVAGAMYTGRNYNLPRLEAESIIVETDATTNLKQIKDLPTVFANQRLVTKDTTQVLGQLLFERVIADDVNVYRKKDLTIENFKPKVEAIFNSYFANNIYYLPIGACYVSDSNPAELLRGHWELRKETKIGKIWERVR